MNLHTRTESNFYTARDTRADGQHGKEMETKVPGRYDRKEGFRRFRAELIRAHEIDLEEYGGVKQAAALLECTQQQITNWKKRGLPAAMMARIAHYTEMDTEYIYQLGEVRQSKRGLESTDAAQSELLKQIAALLQLLRPKKKR